MHLDAATFKTLVILGGTGARASALFHHRVIEAWIQSRLCLSDEDFPNIVHWSCALKGLNARGVHSSSVLKNSITEKLESLQRFNTPDSGGLILAAPCSSLSAELAMATIEFPRFNAITPWSAYFNEWQAGTLQPKAAPPRNSMIFCSASLRKSLEQAELGLHDFPSFEIQAQLDYLIQRAIGSPNLASHALHLKNLVSQHGHYQVVLACTEFSVLNSITPSPFVIDCMDCLLRETISELLT